MTQRKSILTVVFLIAGIALPLISCNTAIKEVIAERNADATATAELVQRATINAVTTQIGAGPFISTANAMQAQMKTASAAFPKTRAALQTQMASEPTSPPTHATMPPVSPAPSAAPISAIITFTVAPTTTLKLGDTITAVWETRATQTVLCPYVMTPTGPYEQTAACVDVPLSGSHSFTIQASDLIWDGILLRVANQNENERALMPLVLGCQGLRDWFMSPPRASCPENAPLASKGLAQPFENGWMLWTENPNRLYVFYNESFTHGTFEFRENAAAFTPDNATENTNVAPPPDLFAPVGTFGEIWQNKIDGFADVRARLGWGTSPATNVDATYQCARSNPSFRLWTCYLNAPSGQVWMLRPDSSAQVHFLWSAQ